MNNELISIIVPTYNIESYVKKIIEYNLKQTYTNIVVICVDDGSADNTYYKCLGFGINKRIVISKYLQ